jgi:tRNA modification GTPase
MDSIVAPMTPLRRSSVILLRVSGDITLALPFFEIKRSLKPNTPLLALFRSRAEPLVADNVLLTFFRAPKSYTGEDVLEISFHGNPLIVQTAITDFLSVGIRYAERGEFTRRALLNQKITLSQAEAAEKLVSAKTSSGVGRAAAVLSGKLDSGLSLIYGKIIESLADMEANIDFAEDITDESPFLPNYIEGLKGIHTDLKGLADRYLAARKALEGERVVIAGKVNAGKSTLFNFLTGEAASIVTEEEGTTRDLITRTTRLDGLEFILTDTAGLREAESAAEREGVRRAEAALKEADLVIWVVSPIDKILDLPDPKKNAIIVASKADLYDTLPDNDFDVWVSAKTGFAIDKLAELIKKRLSLTSSETGLDLITDRQYEEVLEAAKEVGNSISAPTPDIAAFHLTRAADRIKRAGGKDVAEEVLDSVFSKFCVGK